MLELTFSAYAKFFTLQSRQKIGGIEIKKRKVIILSLVFSATATLALLSLLTLHPPPLPEKAHLPLYEEITAIKNRLTVNITETNFTNPIRVCDFYELREEDSEDYFQTTVNYWVFQHGQQEHGDIEAFVEIYNIPNCTDRFIVEVARNCWHELTVSLDGSPVIVFPTITSNTLSLGYMTFEVNPKE